MRPSDRDPGAERLSDAMPATTHDGERFTGPQSIAPSPRHEVAEFALVGLLRGGPCHGYRLAGAFAPQGQLRPILRLKMSQMYAYLNKLERQGWLSATLEHDETAHPRRVFALTPTGERAFDEWVTRPVDATRDIRLEFLVKMTFALERDRAGAARLVARQRAAIVAWLARLRASNAGQPNEHSLTPHGMALGYRIRQCEAVLAWLAAVQDQLPPADPSADL